MISDGLVKFPNGVPGKFDAYKGLGLFTILIVLVFSITTMVVPVGQPVKDSEVDFKYESMEKCRDNSCWSFGLTLLLSFILFIGFYTFQRVLPISGFVAIIIMSIVAIAGINSWNKLDSLFEKMKFYSIIIATVILAFTRVSNITNLTKDRPWLVEGWSWLLWLLLAVNIGEAVYSEMDEGSYINPILGIILILLMPNPLLTGKSWKDLLFVDKGGYRDLVYKTPLFWSILYIIWDANYAYTDKKEHFAIICLVLLAPLLNTLPNSISVNPSLFIQARAYTLFIRYMVIAYKDVFEEYTDSKGWYNEKAKNIWDWINISIVIVFVFYTIATNNRVRNLIGQKRGYKHLK